MENDHKILAFVKLSQWENDHKILAFVKLSVYNTIH